MKCERCNTNPVTVHMAQIINGEKKEMNLCDECSKMIGFGNQISFQDIFQGVLDFSGISPNVFNHSEESISKTANDIVCNKCGMSYNEFRKKGKFGCAECFNMFRINLDSVLKNVHGGVEHTGKIPRRSGGALLIKKEKNDLKNQLEKAIRGEEYEEAARLRDRIRELEKGV